MATADPGSDSVSLFGGGDKLQSQMTSFREAIERKKLEVRRVSEEMRSLIEKKEEEIIGELDTIWEEVNIRMEKKIVTQEDIREFESKKKEIDQILRRLNPNVTQFSQFSEAIESAKREIDKSIPNVKLTWRVDELKDCINRMCRCDQQILVYNEDTWYQLKWVMCKEGRGGNQLYCPWSIATNPKNDNIYVADNGNDRVQIFSRNGKWIRSLKDYEMKNPKSILFYNQSIFVQCNRAKKHFMNGTEDVSYVSRIY